MTAVANSEVIKRLAVLIVESRPHSRALLRSMLLQLEVKKIHEVADGAGALNALVAFSPDVMIAPSEQATFLIHATYVPACGPTQDCFIPPANYHWAIVARVGPWPVAALP